MKQVSLVAPNLDPANILFTATQLRPYRKGGLRLDNQEIKGKHIFHNYGHGGAGVSLAYGSGFACAKRIGLHNLNTPPGTHAAVLGSGVIGLNTAIELARRNYKVTVYAERIPSPEDKPETILASQIAAGKWSPGGYDLAADRVKHELLSKLSFDYYSECIGNKKYKSMKFAKMYDNKSSLEALKDLIPDEIIGDYKNVEVKFTPSNRIERMVEFTSIRINLKIYLQELLSEAKSLGINFVAKSFKSLDDVIALPQTYIANCMGMGSRDVFKDDKLIGVRGHMIYYKNVNNIDYVLLTAHKQDTIAVYSIDDMVALGYSYIEDERTTPEKDKKEYERMMRAAQGYFYSPTARL